MLEALLSVAAVTISFCTLSIWRLHSRVADLRTDLRLANGRAESAEGLLVIERGAKAYAQQRAVDFACAHAQARVEHGDAMDAAAEEHERIAYDRDVLRDSLHASRTLLLMNLNTPIRISPAEVDRLAAAYNAGLDVDESDDGPCEDDECDICPEKH